MSPYQEQSRLLRNLLRRGDATKNDLKGRLALDTSALIELVFSTPYGRSLNDLIRDEENAPHITEIVETELRYILCRRLGEREADERVWKLRLSSDLIIDSIS